MKNGSFQNWIHKALNFNLAKSKKLKMAVNPGATAMAEGASPPVFEQIFRNARFAQGGNALFEGKVKGNPRPQVVWTRKGLQMKGEKLLREMSHSFRLVLTHQFLS